MSNKVTMETKADIDDWGFELRAKGTFLVEFSKRSEIAQMLNVKDKEKFRVTVERIK